MFRSIGRSKSNRAVYVLAVPGLVPTSPCAYRTALQAVDWNRTFEYASKRSDAGLDAREIAATARVDIDLKRDAHVAGIASTGGANRRIRDRYRSAGSSAALVSWLRPPSDDAFLPRLSSLPIIPSVRAEMRALIIAGYHWFSDWESRPMIAIARPGLARPILRRAWDTARLAASVIAEAAQPLSPRRGDAVIQHRRRDLLFFEAVARTSRVYGGLRISYGPNCTPARGIIGGTARYRY